MYSFWRREEGRQDDQPERDAVDAEVVADPQRGDPRDVLDEAKLTPLDRVRGPDEELQRLTDEEETRAHAVGAQQLRRLAREEQRQDAGERREPDEDREEVSSGVHGRVLDQLVPGTTMVPGLLEMTSARA